MGFTVRDRALGLLGTVRGVQHYPASDMLVVGERNLLVPMLAAYGVKINRRKQEITVALPPGFEELSPGLVPGTGQSRR
jgi:ribosomal 30S subunit maturation factor RimM